jgi:hypothetical protein
MEEFFFNKKHSKNMNFDATSRKRANDKINENQASSIEKGSCDIDTNNNNNNNNKNDSNNYDDNDSNNDNNNNNNDSTPNNIKKYKKTISGSQCIFRNLFNCKCCTSDGEGRIHCPSPLSIAEARAKGFLIYPTVNHCPAIGKMFYLPKNVALREKLLDTAGVERNSDEWKRYMTSVCRICGCHFAACDVKPGRLVGSFAFTDIAFCKKPNTLIDLLQSTQISNQIVSRPLLASLDRNEDPLVVKLKKELEMKQNELIQVKDELKATNEKLRSALAVIDEKNTVIKTLGQKLARLNDSFGDDLEDLSCEIESIELVMEEKLNVLSAYENYSSTDYKVLRKIIIQENLAGKIQYNMIWVKEVASRCGMESEYERLLSLSNFDVHADDDDRNISEGKRKKEELKERKIVTTWVAQILATNEKGNFLAKALDSTNMTVDNKRQYVLNSLNMGLSIAQVNRLKAKYTTNYDELVLNNIINKSKANNLIPKYILLAFDDDFVEGWWRKFVNDSKGLGAYLKNLTVMTLDFLEVEKPIGHDSILIYSKLNGIIEMKNFIIDCNLSRSGFLTYFLTQTWQGRHLYLNNFDKQIKDIKEENIHIFSLGNMRKSIHASMKSLKYSQINEIDKMRFQANAFPFKILPMSFKSYKEHIISMLNLVNLKPVLLTLKNSYIPSLGDWPKFKNQYKLQLQLNHGISHVIKLFKAADQNLFNSIVTNNNISEEDLVNLICNKIIILPGPLHMYKINPQSDIVKNWHFFINMIYNRMTGKKMKEDVRVPAADCSGFLEVIGAAWIYLKDKIEPLLRKKGSITSSSFLYLLNNSIPKANYIFELIFKSNDFLSMKMCLSLVFEETLLRRRKNYTKACLYLLHLYLSMERDNHAALLILKENMAACDESKNEGGDYYLYIFFF